MLTPARKFLNLFVNNENAYALQTETGTYKAYRDRQISDVLLEQHLLGEVTLGVYAINPLTNEAKWLCWDCDSEAERELSHLISWLNTFGINVLRESRRSGRSGHIWVLLNRPIPASDAFRILKYGQYVWKIPGEIFPAQSVLKPSQVGSLVRLPLGRHQKPSANGVWGLFEDCSSKAVDQQLMWLLEQPLNDVTDLLESIPKIAEKPSQKRKVVQNKVPLLDEFPNWEWQEQPSGELIGQCPLCREEGHDVKANNLALNPETNVLYCHYSNGVHTFRQILEAARRARNLVYNN